MTDFKDQLKEDLENNFFNKEEFAEEITLIPLGATINQYAINAIFDNEFESVDPDTEAPILSTQPTLRINENDLAAALAPTDKLKIRNENFEIVSNRPDGVGTIILLLHKEL